MNVFCKIEYMDMIEVVIIDILLIGFFYTEPEYFILLVQLSQP